MISPGKSSPSKGVRVSHHVEPYGAGALVARIVSHY